MISTLRRLGSVILMGLILMISLSELAMNCELIADSQWEMAEKSGDSSTDKEKKRTGLDDVTISLNDGFELSEADLKSIPEQDTPLLMVVFEISTPPPERFWS